MILDLHNENLTINGKPINQNEQILIVPVSQHDYIKKSDSNIESEERQYIRISNGIISINTSWFGEYPLFYFVKNKHIILTSSFINLIEKLKEYSYHSLTLDRTGILETMLFDLPLRSRTLFENIYKVLPGKKIEINTRIFSITIQTTFILPFDKGGHKGTKQELLDKAVEIIKGLSKSFEKINMENIILPLSGGLDSRLLACLLNEKGISINALTFGPKESTEIIIARKVAKLLNQPVIHLELKNEYYKTYGDDVTRLTGGLSSPMHCHLFSVLSENSIHGDKIIHGFLGGEYAGASQPDHANIFSMTVDSALRNYIKSHLESKRLWDKITINDKTNIINDLKEIMNENCKQNLPCHFDEYIHNVDRQFSLIANVFSPVESFATLIRPFANKEYAIFFNSLPYEFRKDRRLFIEAASHIFPDAFRLGTQKQIFNKDKIIGKIELIYSFFIAKLAYATIILTNGNFTIKNPKNSERHKELLLKELNQDFISAIEEVAKLLNIDLTDLGKNSILNRKQTVTQYRILSLYRLIEILRKNDITIEQNSA